MTAYPIITTEVTHNFVTITTSSEDGLSGKTYRFGAILGLRFQLDVEFQSNWTRKTKRHGLVHTDIFDRNRRNANLKREDITIPSEIKELALKTYADFFRDNLVADF